MRLPARRSVDNVHTILRLEVIQGVTCRSNGNGTRRTRSERDMRGYTLSLCYAVHEAWASPATVMRKNTCLPPENHARPGVSRESLWRRHSYELVVIGYNQQLLGTVVLDVVPIHLRALSLFVLCGSKGERNMFMCRRVLRAVSTKTHSTEGLQLANPTLGLVTANGIMTEYGRRLGSQRKATYIEPLCCIRRSERQIGTGHTDGTKCFVKMRVNSAAITSNTLNSCKVGATDLSVARQQPWT